MDKKIVQIPIEQLVPYARNARTHSDVQVAQIAASIREFGFNNPVLIKADNTIIAGHGRVLAARKLNLSVVPCICLDHLTDTQARAYVIADNKLAMNAEWDNELLNLELEQLIEADFNVELTGFDVGEIEALADQDRGEIIEDEVPEPPAEPITKPGDLWLLGEHRLLCGDSTKAEDVDRLMAGMLASLVVTDPPYGVSYADKNAFLNAVDKGNHVQTPIENDHLDKESAQKLWKDAFTHMGSSMRPGACVYCFMPQGGDQMMMMMMMTGAGIEPRHELIWVKNNHVLGRTDYAYKHEPIMYAWKSGGHKFYGDFQTSVIEFNRPNSSKLHPTMKPVELIARLVQNSSVVGDVLYEPFLGSGTTLIAAEQLGRKCYGMEISPAYCDVIVKRWETLTGKTAVLDNA